MKRDRADSPSRKKRRPLRRWVVLLLLLFLVAYAHRVWVYETPEERALPLLYKLPFPAGERYICIKGRGVTLLGHHGPAYYSIDFAMPVHSLVVAARAGVVSNIKDDSNIGGRSKKYLPDANRILIDHGDGTIAQYLHLEYKGVLVNVGDRVEQGQPIGYSGNTGASLTPNLHFSVTDKGMERTIPIAFEGPYGVPIIPKMLLSYTSNNVPPNEAAPSLPDAAADSPASR